MSVQSVSPASGVTRGSAIREHGEKGEVSKETDEKFKNKKAIGLTLGCLAILGTAAFMIASSKKPSADKAKEAAEAVSLFGEIEFKEGIARKNGDLFTGTIKDVVSAGDTIELTYQDGKIVKSVRQGAKNYVKEYKGGIIKTVEDGVTRVHVKTSDGHQITNEQGEILKQYQKLGKNLHRITTPQGVQELQFADGKRVSRKIITENGKFIRTVYYGEKVPYRLVEEYKNPAGLVEKRVSVGDNLLTESFYTEGKFAGRLKTKTLHTIGMDTTEFFKPDGRVEGKLVVLDCGLDKQGRVLKKYQRFDGEGKLTGINIEHRSSAGSSGVFIEEMDADGDIVRTINKTVVNSKDSKGRDVRTLVTEIFDANGKLLESASKVINHN